MTAQDREIKELRRKVKLLEKKNKELAHIHQLDLAEIVYLRRLTDFFMEAAE